MGSHQEMTPLSNNVELRDVVESDLEVFFTHQLDEEANRLIGFSPRSRDDFDAHWANVLTDEDNVNKTIVSGDKVGGNIVSFLLSGEREVGYWLGREYWGRGVATQALALFVEHVKSRPLFAHVAKRNTASVRVLEKCGFVVVGEDKMPSQGTAEELEEWIMRLD